jgi:hypothetical protein
MLLPWKGSRLGLIVAVGENRRFRLFLLIVTTLGTVAFSFVNPQIIR